MARWVTLDSRSRGWRFYCSACGEVVYWPQATQGTKKRIRVCPYPTCPWCREKMEVGDGKENEN